METEWRCNSCGKLLGLLRSDRLHLRFARGHEYLVTLPATSICRGCRALNELKEATANAAAPAAASR